MALVHVLVTTHLALTAALLLAFAGLVLCQRLFAAARPGAAATPLPPAADPYPAEPVALPLQEPAARRELPPTPASVLQWTLDLRTPTTPGGRSGDVALSGTS